MVFKLPSARCLSKSRREGHLSENMANPAMRTSVKGIAVSSLRSSGTLAKRLRTKPKSASAERCLRSLGAMKPISTPKMTTSKREIVSVRGGLSHGGLRKSSCDIGVFTGVRCLPGIAAHVTVCHQRSYVETYSRYKGGPRGRTALGNPHA